jgi:hypothetical protein
MRKYRGETDFQWIQMLRRVTFSLDEKAEAVAGGRDQCRGTSLMRKILPLGPWGSIQGYLAHEKQGF